MTTRTPIPIPPLGFGLWKLAPEACADAVYEAIKAGYRHLDGACDYGNEAAVGEGLARALGDGLCRREDLWITSKLWNTYHDPEHVPLALERNAGGSTLRLPGSLPDSFPHCPGLCAV